MNVPGLRVVEVQLWEYLAADPVVRVAAGEDLLVPHPDHLPCVGLAPLDRQEHLIGTSLGNNFNMTQVMNTGGSDKLYVRLLGM